MTDDEQQQTFAREWETQDWTEADGLLSELTGSGLLDEVELKVTLIVHGQIIVGTVIGGPRWFREQLEQAEADPETHPGEFARFYRQMRARADELNRVVNLPVEQSLTKQEEKILLDFTHVLHLKDAQVRTLAANVTYPSSVYMRVRLGSVDAWYGGSMEVSTSVVKSA